MIQIRNYRPTVLEISLSALERNLHHLRSLIGPKTFFCPMVKANAYGHGDVAIARALSQWGCRTLGVALIEEAIHLRSHGIGGDILVMDPFEKAGAEAIVEFELTPVVSRFDALEDLRQVVLKRGEQRFPIHLKFNTGMNRLGFAPEKAWHIAEYLRSHPELELKGLCTHLAFAEDAGEAVGHSARAIEQFYAIEKIFTEFRPATHIYTGAAMINVAHKHRLGKLPTSYRWPEGCRPGIALYGYDLGAHVTGEPRVEPIAQLKSNIIMVHDLRPGESVSYGGIWTSSGSTTIAVVPVGYADGYPRQLSNKAFVLFRGQRVPVIGHVCMDYLMIEVTPFANDNIRIGEEVVLWGEQLGERLAIEELCRHLHTIPYTLLSGVSERVMRKYI